MLPFTIDELVIHSNANISSLKNKYKQVAFATEFTFEDIWILKSSWHDGTDDKDWYIFNYKTESFWNPKTGNWDKHNTEGNTKCFYYNLFDALEIVYNLLNNPLEKEKTLTAKR